MRVRVSLPVLCSTSPTGRGIGFKPRAVLVRIQGGVRQWAHGVMDSTQGYEPWSTGSNPIELTAYKLTCDVTVASKTLTLGVKVRILSGHQNGVSSLSGKAPRCEREEQGSSPGVHPKGTVVKLVNTQD